MNNIDELTLLLMYLTPWEEKGYIKDEEDNVIQAKVRTCWKGYSFGVINKLTEEELLYYSKGKSVTLTKKGEQLA